ncbi:condensation domain-containing protein, partial [Flavitalea flava]
MREKKFPLHPAQREVYIDQLINCESPHYNVGGYIKLIGELKKELLRNAVASVPEVFDVFKMRFELNEQEYAGYIDPDYEQHEFKELDFTGHVEPEQAAQSWMQERFNIPFVISREQPLFELYLLKINEKEYLFFNKYHHLITDGYGFTVWAQYIAQKYRSLLQGEEIFFSYPAYIKEAVSSAEYYNSEGYEKEGKYWKEKISDKPPRLFPAKYNNDGEKDSKSGKFFLTISNEKRDLFERLQTATRSSLQQLTIAALLLYLAKTSSQSDFVFGIPIHKRRTKQLRNIVGMFSGILPFKGSYSPDIILSDLIRSISTGQKSDYRNQNFLLGDLNRFLKNNSSDGFLDIIVNYQLLNFGLDFGEDITATTFELSSEYAKYPLQIWWRDYGKQQPLQFFIDFQKACFNQQEIEILADRLLFVLEQFEGALHKPVGDLSLLSPVEEYQLSQEINSCYCDYPRDITVTGL